jgi:hypothetical protein
MDSSSIPTVPDPFKDWNITSNKVSDHQLITG